MNDHRIANRLRVSEQILGLRRSRGVVLLVMLGLLSIFTLVAVTFVVSSGHARRGAASAARVEQMGDPFDVLLNQAMMQVARGSNHPQSAIGPHGLLEDIYGNSNVVAGSVYFANKSPGPSIYDEAPLSSQRSQYNAFGTAAEKYLPPMLIEIGGVSFGWDREPGVAQVDDNGNMVIDDVSEADALTGDDCFLGMMRAHPATVGIPPSGWAGAWKDGTTPVIDNVENYYAGRVITFVNGDCAGQSSYIVRSKIVTDANDNTNVRTVLFINPFANGSQPRHNDRYVINGRAFSGMGFGYSPYNRDGTPKSINNPEDIPRLRALDFPYMTGNGLLSIPGYGFDTLTAEGEPIAVLPNPTDSGYRDYITRFAPIVGANEDYDAPDEQNMLLSYTAATSTGYRTIFPSLHRPDLVRYHTNEHAPGGRWLDVPPYVRRRYILRPDPSDHYDYTQELNAMGPSDGDGWTPGEPYTDVNLNGQYDPGEPYDDVANPTKNGVYDIGDRSFANSGFDAMNGPWDVDNDGDGVSDSIWVDLGMTPTTTPDGKFVKPLFAILVRDMDGRINVNAHGSPKHYTRIHNTAYFAEGPYAPQQRPADNRYNTEERVRIGIYNYALLQLAGSVVTTTGATPGAGTDIVKTHSAGDVDPSFHVMSPQDVKFDFNKLFALSYNGDRPGTNSLVPNAAYMFDISGFRNFLDGNADYDRIINTFEPAVGQGHSVADVNIAPVLQNQILGMPGLPSPAIPPGPTVLYYRYNPIRRILEGQGDFGGDLPPREGRYGESHLLRPVAKYQTTPPIYGFYPGTGVVPRAGVTDFSLPRRDYWQTPFAINHLAANSGIVPHMGGPDDPLTVPAADYYPQAPYSGDDDNPRLPMRTGYPLPVSDTRFQFGSTGRNTFKQFVGNYMLNPVTKAVLTNPTTGQPISEPIVGDYGTPGDFDSDGFVALDIMGNPVYEKMGTAFEDVDAPTEINLNRRYFAQTYFGAGGSSRTDAGHPVTADVDAPYTPAEFERLLRSRDVNAASLPNRLWNNLYDTSASYVAWDADRSITTEQWDVPCPHIAPTPELSYALNALNLPLTNPSLGDLLRARFFLASGNSISANQTAQLATIAMRSYRIFDSESPVNGQLPVVARKRGQTRLLSPDLGMGVRMDLNAPFGNGFDDNGNTVVDEPTEPPQGTNPFDILAGAPGAFMNFDGNRDGNYIYGVEEEARQQYAKELYCLMMLLVDQNYVEPAPTSVRSDGGVGGGAEALDLPTMNAAAAAQVFVGMTAPNPSNPGLNLVQLKTHRWLFARKIAQWAVNCVDFRDRDAIMTPFEFDADPFFDNDLDATDDGIKISRPTGNGTWDVDGYVIRNDARPPAATPMAAPDYTKDPDLNAPWRGLVWGCEYPDLILSETLAFHDRRTQNLKGLSVTTGTGSQLSFTFATTNSLSPSSSPLTPTDDPNWDQRRVPQGTALFELFATGNRHNPALPRELYSVVTYTDQVSGRQLTEMKLDLGRIAGNPTGPGGSGASTPYPVWRLVITESHTRNVATASALTGTNLTRLSIAERIQEWPATCSLELNDPGMSLLNPNVFSGAGTSTALIPVEKVIHFSSSTSTQLNFSAKIGLVTSSPTSSTNIEVYSNQYKGSVDSAYLSPGDYAVIGPYRAPASGPRNITTVGRTETRMVSITNTTSVTDVSYAQPHAIIDMGDWVAVPKRPFLITSVNGINEYPRTGLASPTLATLVKSPVDVGAVDFPNPTAPANSQQIRPPLAIPVACTSLPPSARLVGLNISEPNTAYVPSQYYPLPNVNRPDSWLPTLVTTDRYNPVKDVPLDDDNDGNMPISATNRNKSLPFPTVDETVLNYKTVFLQRIANPLMPWDRWNNPYLTVDWMPIDLTVFNGEPHHFDSPTAPSDITSTRLFYEPVPESRYVPPTSVPANAIRFGSRQRGAPRYPVRGRHSLFDLWSQPNWLDTSPEFDTRPPPTGRVSDSPANIFLTTQTTTPYKDYYKVQPVKFQDPLNHTLGYLNQGYHVLRDWPFSNLTGPDPKGLQLTPVREPIRRPMAAAAVQAKSGFYTLADVTRNNDKYIGAPRRPFNWLTWNNRPYAGSMELMLVPSTSISRLMHEYSMRRTITPSAPDTPTTAGVYNARLAPFDPRRAANHYMPKLPAQGATNWVAPGSSVSGRLASGYSMTAPFAHLLNFFESSTAVMADPGLPVPVAANYFRLFEFVNVPSRFSGTKQMHFQGGGTDATAIGRNNAAAPSSGTASAPNGTADEHFGWPFTAPFNYIPLYREPGRININTIIPLGSRAQGPVGATGNLTFARTHRNERMFDDGASIWRSVLNDFHPTIKFLAPVDGAGQNGSNSIRGQMSYGVRAGAMTNASTLSSHKYSFNPSEDYADNFHSLFASMFTDSPTYDPRGPNGVYESGNGDDAFSRPFWVADPSSQPTRSDGARPSLFSNPFRSFMADYSDTIFDANVSKQKYRSAASGNPLLAADATLMRRRDTTWSPYNPTWRPDGTDANNAVAGLEGASPTSRLFSPAQLDPRFDPMFTLNYPRPFRPQGVVTTTATTTSTTAAVTPMGGPLWWQYSGYSSPLVDARAGMSMAYPPTSTQVDVMRVKDSDFRNTDRNPFFRYQMYTKLSNTITTRSNVYAIWITIGFFECEKVQPGVRYKVQNGHNSDDEFVTKHRYPDGFRIMRELGSDTGEAQRHRAFGILDRTIPVGFMRGENLNVDRAFIIRHILD